MVRQGNDVLLPRYLFCTSGIVTWQDAVVGWTLFYHLLPQLNLRNKRSVQKVLDKLVTVGAGNFVYFRWDSKGRKYLRYEGKKTIRRKS